MLWPSASEMLTSERITDKEKDCSRGCKGIQRKDLKKRLQQRIAGEDKEKDCSRGLQGNTKKIFEKDCSRGLQRLDRRSGF
jgi:hypothetical protein